MLLDCCNLEKYRSLARALAAPTTGAHHADTYLQLSLVADLVSTDMNTLLAHGRSASGHEATLMLMRSILATCARHRQNALSAMQTSPPCVPRPSYRETVLAPLLAQLGGPDAFWSIPHVQGLMQRLHVEQATLAGVWCATSFVRPSCGRADCFRMMDQGARAITARDVRILLLLRAFTKTRCKPAHTSKPCADSGESGYPVHLCPGGVVLTAEDVRVGQRLLQASPTVVEQIAAEFNKGERTQGTRNTVHSVVLALLHVHFVHAVRMLPPDIVEAFGVEVNRCLHQPRRGGARVASS